MTDVKFSKEIFMTFDAKELLDTRTKTHGSYQKAAALSDKLIKVFEDNPRWPHFPAVIRHCIRQICVKLSRIVCGECSYADHWKDIPGNIEGVLECLRDENTDG